MSLCLTCLLWLHVTEYEVVCLTGAFKRNLDASLPQYTGFEDIVPTYLTVHLHLFPQCLCTQYCVSEPRIRTFSFSSSAHIRFSLICPLTAATDVSVLSFHPFTWRLMLEVVAVLIFTSFAWSLFFCSLGIKKRINNKKKKMFFRGHSSTSLPSTKSASVFEALLI